MTLPVIEVCASHNLDSRFDPYQPDHRVVLVYRGHVPAGTADIDACELVFELLNIGHDADYSEPNPDAVAYRARGNRSLSVGDLVSVDGRWFSCGRFGWSLLEAEPLVVAVRVDGSSPLA
jgi:hypothetical protein